MLKGSLKLIQYDFKKKKKRIGIMKPLNFGSLNIMIQIIQTRHFLHDTTMRKTLGVFADKSEAWDKLGFFKVNECCICVPFVFIK